MTGRVVLVGLPGVGKTTIGAALATALGVEFVDVDDVVAALEGATPATLLRTAGEQAFRAAEERALAAALGRRGDLVVATGGGVVESEGSRQLLDLEPTVVHLTAPPEVIAARLAAGGDRPLVAEPTAERLAALEARRAPLYAAVAAESVVATGPIGDVVSRICGLVARA